MSDQDKDKDLTAIVERLDPVGNAPEVRIARQKETIQQLMEANKRVAEERDTLVQTLKDRAGDYVGLQRQYRLVAEELLSKEPKDPGFPLLDEETAQDPHPWKTPLTEEGNNPTRAQLLQQIKDLARMLEGFREVNQYLDKLLESARHFFGSSVVRLLITTPENTPMEECFPNLRKAMVGDLTKMQAVKRQRDELLDAFEKLDRGQNLFAMRAALEEAYYPVKRAILEGSGYPHRDVERQWAEYIASHDREVMEANESRVEMAMEIGRLRRDLHKLARELEETRVADARVLSLSRGRVDDCEAALIAIRHAHPDRVIEEILELVLGAPREE